MDKTRAGKGCGSCKSLVEPDRRVGRRRRSVQEDPAGHCYVPGVPMAKPELMDAIREQSLDRSRRSSRRWRRREEDAKSKMGLASLLKMMWGDEYVDERDARFINDRVHANIQRDGTFSVVPQMKGGVTTPDQLRRIADVAEKYDVPMVKLTGGQRIDLLGHPARRRPAGDLGRPRHAVRLRLRQELPHREDLRRQRLLPLRGRRLAPRSASRSRSGSRGSRGPGR